MANLVSMTTQKAIKALHERGYSKRKIARELGIHRNTVDNYLDGSEEREGSECTKPTTGSEAPEDGVKGPECSKCTIPTTGSGDPEDGESGPDDSKCTIPTAGTEGGSGRRSQCEPYREIIESKLETGLEATRIWQDLVDDHEFKHAYESVKRFVRKLKAAAPQRVWRMECEPGEEVQVDYGTVRTKIGGKMRKIHVLRVTLSHSRKGYTEAMPRQDTESFVRGIENAFRHFGGVPEILVLDNLKAGVLKPDIYDPELNPKFASFCEHYNVTAMPTLPRTPEHKGKVERGVAYAKNSAVKGRDFGSLAELNVHLRDWERRIADKRIHGTTRKQVGAHFIESEKPALRNLPPEIFPSFVEGRRSVHRDSYIEFERAYYEVPEEYIGRQVWARCDGRMVHVFNLRMEQVTVHAKLEAGQFSKVVGCGGTPTSVRDSLRRWTQRAAEIGPDAGLWAEGLVATRKAAGLRVMMGLVNQLLPRHGSEAVNRACAQARLHGQYRLRELGDWLERPDSQQAFSFLSEHEVIRDMADYGKFAGFEQSN